MRCVGTFIFERPRPLSRHGRADHHYTPICEEPVLPTIIQRYGAQNLIRPRMLRPASMSSYPSLMSSSEYSLVTNSSSFSWPRLYISR